MFRRNAWIGAVAPFLLVFAALLEGAGARAAAPPTPKGPEGTWAYLFGVSPFGGTCGFLTLERGPKGSLVASFEDPQSRRTQNFSFVTVKGRNVQVLEFGLVSIFEAELSPDGATLNGKLMLGGSWQPLRLFRYNGERPKFPRPQEPKKPYPYDEEEVTFPVGKDGVRLAGTLTRPRGAGPHPAALLISGSAPVDRDGSSAGHMPFLVLADALTRRGLAVLRVDARGVGRSGGKAGLATTTERVADVEAALAFLRKREDIAPGRVGLVGHSEGASVAALTASRDRDVAWLVLLAAPGLPGDRLMLCQAERGWQALKPLGLTDAFIEFQIGLQKKTAEALKRAPDESSADEALKAVLAGARADLTREQRRRMGVGEGFQVGAVGSARWLHHFVTHDPREALRKVRCPVLALNGDTDLLVWSKENLPEVEKALKAGGNRDCTIKELPGLNHMLQTSRTGRPMDYVMIDETIAPSALKLIGDWAAGQKGRAASARPR